MDSSNTTNDERPAPLLTQVRDCLKSIPDKGLFVCLVVLWLLPFAYWGNSTFGYVDTSSMFRWMFSAYNSPGTEEEFGNFLPFVVLFLFYHERSRLLPLMARPWRPALGLLAAAAMLHVVGYVVQQPRISLAAMLMGGYCILGVVWGWRFLVGSFFPYWLLFFCIPIGSLIENITFPLRLLSTDLSVWITTYIFGVPIIQDGVRIFDPEGLFQYEVAAACSGIRSLISLFILTTIFSFVTVKAWWKRVVLIGLTVPLAIAGNVLRLLILMLVSEIFGQKIGEMVHDWLGFITFAISLSGIVIVQRWMERGESERSPGPGRPAQAHA